MPIYEYECIECKVRHEVIQRFSDPAVTECPSCGGSVRKLFSSPAIQFKGSGFYKTDYANGGSGGSKGAAAEAKSESSGSADKGESAAKDSGSETKSAVKSETKSETKSE